MTRVAVILHERLGTWVRQLRPRLHEQPVRWLETRSQADLDGILTGLAFPVVVIDLGHRAAPGLKDLALVLRRASDSRVLVIDPEAHEEVARLARELGATCVLSGFVPPPVVAGLLSRWIVLARRGLDGAGWYRTSFPETATEPWGWLSRYVSDGDGSVFDRGRPGPMAPGRDADGPYRGVAIDP